MKLKDSQVEQLLKPIDPRFLSTRFDGMTAIAAIGITMRLNQVFGYGAWQIRTDNMRTRPIDMKGSTWYYSTCKVIFNVPEYDIHYECEAGSQNKEEGDSAKGAITDSITKIASWMGIGWEVYNSKK
jgi:hypothetical protein